MRYLRRTITIAKVPVPGVSQATTAHDCRSASQHSTSSCKITGLGTSGNHSCGVSGLGTTVLWLWGLWSGNHCPEGSLDWKPLSCRILGRGTTVHRDLWPRERLSRRFSGLETTVWRISGLGTAVRRDLWSGNHWRRYRGGRQLGSMAPRLQWGRGGGAGDSYRCVCVWVFVCVCVYPAPAPCTRYIHNKHNTYIRLQPQYQICRIVHIYLCILASRAYLPPFQIMLIMQHIVY